MFTSMMTFIYVDNIKRAEVFFETCLGLELIFKPSWANVYKVSASGFLGLVEKSKGSISKNYLGGTLISLTVENVDLYYERIKAFGVNDLSEIKTFDDIGVKSFFFKGPGDYDFEIQMFTREEIRKLFE
jgi:predicted enzyme related to lactoylglutathione lyase